MKLLLALMFISTTAFATGYSSPLQPSSNAIGVGVASAKTDVTANGGYTNIKYVTEKPAASSSPAASSNTTADCRYLEQWALSVVILNGSSTKMLRDLVCTLEKPLNPLQKLALCIDSGDYRNLRYYISTLPPENGKVQEGACAVGGSSRVMSN